jgi:hypothetical protein
LRIYNLIIYLLFFIFIGNTCFSQNRSEKSFDVKNQWFVSSGYGMQISGIKSEDFISSNVSPSFLFNIGKWVSPVIALQIGYKGFYFRTISDNIKHHYTFIYGEVLININELILRDGGNYKWKLISHLGPGYFYNNLFSRANINANFGVINSVNISNRFDVFIDVSAIIGWDIYQGDNDILPSVVFGVTYSFK